MTETVDIAIVGAGIMGPAPRTTWHAGARRTLAPGHASRSGGGVLWLRTLRPIALFNDSDVSRVGAAKPS